MQDTHRLGLAPRHLLPTTDPRRIKWRDDPVMSPHASLAALPSVGDAVHYSQSET